MTTRQQKKTNDQKSTKKRNTPVQRISKGGKDLGEMVLNTGHRAADAGRETAHELARAGKNLGIGIERTGHDIKETGQRSKDKISETLGKGIEKAGHAVEVAGYDIEEELSKMEKKVDHRRDRKTA
jgi:hypothetical protein